MPYERTIASIRQSLKETFRDIDLWFDRPEELKNYQPTSGGWSIREVLEHISLTNHFLMLTLTKWVAIAMKRASRGVPIPDGESDLDHLNLIGVRGSFVWDRPTHMEPTGRLGSVEVRAVLAGQLSECLRMLEQMGRGEGSLCRVRMTVNALGKIDLYQWLYFLVQHARRHLQQMTANQAEYELLSISRLNQNQE